MDLRIRLKHQYPNFLMDIDLDVSSSRLGILGASGAGKSMMLKMIAGIMTPKEGYVAIGEKVLLDTSARINVKAQKRRVGYLFQNYALFPSMTVEENIGAGVPGKNPDKKKIVADMVERFQLAGLEKQTPQELSGGQQQRVALAMIVANGPDMILLDEPFSALDIHLRDRMQRELLSRLADFPGPVFMVSHSRDEIYRFSDEIIIIDQGRIIDQGKKEEVFSRPKNKRAAALTGCKNFSRAQRIDQHSLLAEGWGVVLHTARKIPDNLKDVGYRAHDFIPVWGNKEENCIPFLLERKDELPFEQNYYIRPDREDYDEEDVISWFVQRETRNLIKERGFPDYIKFNGDELLLLT